MYRPEIKVVDCTVRDGGLMNKWQFEDDLVEQVVAGVDVVVGALLRGDYPVEADIVDEQDAAGQFGLGTSQVSLSNRHAVDGGDAFVELGDAHVGYGVVPGVELDVGK